MKLLFWPVVRLSIIAALTIVTLGSCGGNDGGDSSGDARIRVVTTLPLFADFVRQIGGDRVHVSSLLPSGADPHTYELAPGDVREIADADLAFANGLDLEPGLINVLEANLRESAPLIKLGEVVAQTGAPYSSEDPHLWMDPANAERYALPIRLALVSADSEGTAAYEGNHRLFADLLGELEGYITGKMASIAEEERKLVTTHDAFGYFADRFGLEVVGIVAPSPGQEPSPEDVADLARAIKDESVPAVFVEPQISSEGDVLRQAAADAGVDVCTLYSDSLDDRVTGYIELMRFNADELERCLGR